MILDLLDIEKLETPTFKLTRAPTDRNWLAERLHARRTIADRRAIMLELCAPADAVLENVDAMILGRVLDNLPDNAVRHTPSGGRVALDLVRGADATVQVRVGNSGPAVPAAAREVIFERNVSGACGQRGHSGLGLYYCKLAIQAHEGRIWVEETRDLPTVFVIELPVPVGRRTTLRS
jgi:signal transduction histidine kinase